MVRALSEYRIEGLKTLIPFHSTLLQTEQWANAETARDLLEDKSWLKALAFPKVDRPAEDEPEKVEHDYQVEVSGKRFDVKVIGAAFAGGGVAAPAPGAGAAPKPKRGDRKSGGGAGGGDTLESPLQGNVWKILVEAGQTVEEGQIVTIIEAMKMENEITAHKAGTIAELPIKEGDAVSAGATLAIISSNGAGADGGAGA
jgi:acetyl-CoA/propionyl-CoA carboxylase biotin carboxyl carrier protein